MNDDLRVRSEDEAPEAPTPLAQRLRGWARDIVITVLGVSVLFFGLAWLRAPALPEAAPDFTLTALDGSTVTLSSLRGQPVVLNFWATWCGPCKLELPTLTGFGEGHPDVRVLYVAVDGAPEALTAFAKDNDMPLDDVLRIDAATKKAYTISTLPTTVVVEPDGGVGAMHAGILLPFQLSFMTGSW